MKEIYLSVIASCVDYLNTLRSRKNLVLADVKRKISAITFFDISCSKVITRVQKIRARFLRFFIVATTTNFSPFFSPLYFVMSKRNTVVSRC